LHNPVQKKKNVVFAVFIFLLYSPFETVRALEREKNSGGKEGFFS
jgi:hypothetical protein